MENIINELGSLMESIEHGDITRDDIVAKMTSIILDMELASREIERKNGNS